VYRIFTIKDAAQKIIKFKVWPNLASRNKNKLVYEKVEIELKLDSNKAMLALVDAIALFMDENTINKVVVEEVEEGGKEEKEEEVV